MGPLTALLLATPIFGLSLTPPKLEALPVDVAPMAQFESELSGEAELGEDGEGSGDTEATVDEETSEPSAKGPRRDEPKLSKDEFREQMRKRGKLAKIHRTMGITTWALTGVAVIAGTIQWRNLYAGSIGDNPCVKGTAWLGQGQCSGQPWFHELTGFGAGAAYFTTLALAIAMPDPDHADRGDSAYAKNIRTHKILRWVHLTGMVSQIVLGTFMANDGLNGGLNRAEDYGKLRKLSIVHLSLGYLTFGALSWAGYIML
jgi:hypothetical protein